MCSLENSRARVIRIAIAIPFAELRVIAVVTVVIGVANVGATHKFLPQKFAFNHIINY
jgi:hypothetical protein